MRVETPLGVLASEEVPHLLDSRCVQARFGRRGVDHAVDFGDEARDEIEIVGEVSPLVGEHERDVAQLVAGAIGEVEGRLLGRLAPPGL